MFKPYKNVSYEHLIFTSFKLYETEDPKKVTFKEADRGEPGDKDACFLNNIEQISGRKSGKCEFKANKLTIEEAVEIIQTTGKKPLFLVHGFLTEPGDFLEETNTKIIDDASKLPLYGKSYCIPVFWPAGAKNLIGVPSYSEDKVDAEGAANAFLETLKTVGELIPHKDLITFSMGNFVLRKFSGTNVKFDNIFQLGADVRFDLYHKKYIESGEEGCEDGLKIFNMLKKKEDNTPLGNIHVIYNRGDKALWASSTGLVNNIRRLGDLGPHMKIIKNGVYEEDKELTHSDIRNYLVGRPKTDGEKASNSHNYYFDKWARDAVEGFIGE